MLYDTLHKYMECFTRIRAQCSTIEFDDRLYHTQLQKYANNIQICDNLSK